MKRKKKDKINENDELVKENTENVEYKKLNMRIDLIEREKEEYLKKIEKENKNKNNEEYLKKIEKEKRNNEELCKKIELRKQK